MTTYAEVPAHVVDPDQWLAEQERRTQQRALFHPGSIILDASPDPEPVWGSGSEVLASRGESLIITGGIGSGKTTLLGNLVHARLGLSNQVLGWPVVEGGRVLYLACDRPRQIMRNLRRRFSEADRDTLNNRLIVWRGPLPGDLLTNPRIIREMCAAHDLGDGDTVVVDGIKDIARKITDDETGGAINQAFQMCLVDGIEVWANHHQRKAQNGSNAHKPKSLADVYGSTWITAGAGTVVLLWADKPGSPYAEMSTLKPAADDVGPIGVYHDLDTGAMTSDAITVEVFLVDTRHVASSVADVVDGTGGDPGDRNQIERVRRRLEKLHRDRLVDRGAHQKPGGGKPENRYQWIGPVTL